MSKYLDERDYDLFIIQVQDYVFGVIDDLIDWGAPARVKTLIQKATDMAWRVGITVEEWEDGAAQFAQQLFNCPQSPSKAVGDERNQGISEQSLTWSVQSSAKASSSAPAR